MNFAEEQLNDLRSLCREAKVMPEGQHVFVFLSGLRLRHGSETLTMDALLCPQEHSGYATRLFLERSIPDRGANWTIHSILGKPWHTWSWKEVSNDQTLIEILGGHIVALK
jgi:hypothetical protein